MTDQATLASATLSGRYTELPKVPELVALGVTPELIPTLHALADYGNNLTGTCYPHMITLARKLGRSVRTIQRHLHQLADLGLVEFVERLRTDQGKYRGYVYRITHAAGIATRRRDQRNQRKEEKRRQREEKERKKRERAKKRFSQSTGHGWPVPEDRVTSRKNNTPLNPPPGGFKEGYEWFFGEATPPREREEKPERDNASFKEGYEWFFD